MGAELNKSYDLILADKFYEACRILGHYVEHRSGLFWSFQNSLTIDIPDEFNRLVREYASSVFASKSPIRGWKLPETGLVLPWIVRMFPDAYYVYWVRDPRDSIIGAHKTDDLADFSVPYDRVESIREMRAISWKYQRAIVAGTPTPRRWLEVKFEDFILQQEGTLKRLESFLGIELTRIPVSSESVGRWKNDDEINNFDMFREDLAQLGYVE